MERVARAYLTAKNSGTTGRASKRARLVSSDLNMEMHKTGQVSLLLTRLLQSLLLQVLEHVLELKLLQLQLMLLLHHASWVDEEELLVQLRRGRHPWCSEDQLGRWSSPKNHLMCYRLRHDMHHLAKSRNKLTLRKCLHQSNATCPNDRRTGLSNPRGIGGGSLARFALLGPALALLVVIVAELALVAVGATASGEEAAAPAGPEGVGLGPDRGVQGARRWCWRGNVLNNPADRIVFVVFALVHVFFVLLLLALDWLVQCRGRLGQRKPKTAGAGIRCKDSGQHCGGLRSGRGGHHGAVAVPVEEAVVVAAAPRRGCGHRRVGPLQAWCRRLRG
mmetsp:Transcript_42742/g.108531  ORF Transcript_42742/g.108531 Transcript_42742/m.108531 type:complete len:334 (-) Transcript_42742:450-1451(-)